MSTPRHTAGFTLMEMMIALLILAILSLMVVPMTGNIGIREQVNEALELAEPLKKPIEDYWEAMAEFPADNEAANLPDPDKLIGNYTTRIEVTDGAMHIHFGNKANTKLHNKILSLQLLYVDDSPMSPVSWNCGYSNPPPGMSVAGSNLTSIENKYLPLLCRDIPYAGTPE